MSVWHWRVIHVLWSILTIKILTQTASNWWTDVDKTFLPQCGSFQSSGAKRFEQVSSFMRRKKPSINSFVVKAVYIQPIFSLSAIITWVAQWCTSCHDQPRPCVRNPCTKPKGTMCLLVGVVAKDQAPRWLACHQLVLGFFFGCGSTSLESPDHENSSRKCQFVTAIFCDGGSWGLDGKPTTSSVDPHGRPLVGRPITSPIWPLPWRFRIFV